MAADEDVSAGEYDSLLIDQCTSRLEVSRSTLATFWCGVVRDGTSGVPRQITERSIDVIARALECVDGCTSDGAPKAALRRRTCGLLLSCCWEVRRLDLSATQTPIVLVSVLMRKLSAFLNACTHPHLSRQITQEPTKHALSSIPNGV